MTSNAWRIATALNDADLFSDAIEGDAVFQALDDSQAFLFGFGEGNPATFVVGRGGAIEFAGVATFGANVEIEGNLSLGIFDDLETVVASVLDGSALLDNSVEPRHIDGPLTVEKGGTGLESIGTGSVPFGGDADAMQTSPVLRFDCNVLASPSFLATSSFRIGAPGSVSYSFGIHPGNNHLHLTIADSAGNATSFVDFTDVHHITRSLAVPDGIASSLAVLATPPSRVYHPPLVDPPQFPATSIFTAEITLDLDPQTEGVVAHVGPFVAYVQDGRFHARAGDAYHLSFAQPAFVATRVIVTGSPSYGARLFVGEVLRDADYRKVEQQEIAGGGGIGLGGPGSDPPGDVPSQPYAKPVTLMRLWDTI